LKNDPITPADQRGRAWERKVFGQDIHKYRANPTYLGWQDAIEDVVRSQKRIYWNPKKPKTKTGIEIFECVQSYLPQFLASELELYCAIGTSLDFHHGVDGFFMIHDFIVTIDLTTGWKSSHKAEVLIVRSNVGNSIWRPCR
jgi:hypothetical protein